MKRLLAVIGAVAMIGGSILVRGAMTGDGGGGANGSSGGGGTHLICATELEAACATLADEDSDLTFDVEDAGITAERFVDPAFRPADTDIDGWLTLAPWPELVNLRRELAGDGAVLGDPSDVLATAKLTIVGPTERIDLLTTACGGEPQTGWKCLGGLADEPWADYGGDSTEGSIEVGHDEPTESATGLLVLGQAASDWFGDTGFARNDFVEDAGFRPWLAQLENANPGLTPAFESLPVLQQLERLPTSSWDAVGTLDPEARASKRRSATDLTVLYPSPMIRAEAVLAPITGHEADIAADQLTAALEPAGWAPGPAPQDTPDGPSAGVYEALIEEWKQAT